MAVVIRLSRCGSKHSPKYRVKVADQRFSAKGRFIEIVGQYNPLARGQEAKINLKLERIEEWIGKGAQPTKTVQSLIKKFKAEGSVPAEAAAPSAES